MGCGCGGSQQAPVPPGQQQQNAPAPRMVVEDRSVWNGPKRKPDDAPTPAVQGQ